MPNKLEVMMDEILQKKFGKRIHSGYDPEDVDHFFDYVITYLNEVNVNVNRLQEELKTQQGDVVKLKEQIEQKNNTINTLNSQIDYFRREGYDHQRHSNEIINLREEIANLKKTEKNR
jgi:DivIVA domain-containing protein